MHACDVSVRAIFAFGQRAFGLLLCLQCACMPICNLE
jgi:hypothetical protein